MAKPPRGLIFGVRFSGKTSGERLKTFPFSASSSEGVMAGVAARKCVFSAGRSRACRCPDDFRPQLIVFGLDLVWPRAGAWRLRGRRRRQRGGRRRRLSDLRRAGTGRRRGNRRRRRRVIGGDEAGTGGCATGSAGIEGDAMCGAVGRSPVQGRHHFQICGPGETCWGAALAFAHG